MTTKGCGVSSRVTRLGNLNDVCKERVKHCQSFSRHIGECLVPHVESSFFRITDVEVTQNNVHSIGK